MATLHSLHSQFILNMILRNRDRTIFEIGSSVQASSTTDVQFTECFRIKIQENIAIEHAWLKAISTCHTSFLIVSHKHFDRTMLKSLIFEDGQGNGNTNAIISSKSSPLGSDPIPDNLSLNRISQEIMLRIRCLLRHHIHVTLKHNCLAVFIPLGSRYAHNYIASIIAKCFDTVILAPFEQIFLHLALMLRWTRNLCQAIKIVPNDLWL